MKYILLIAGISLAVSLSAQKELKNRDVKFPTGKEILKKQQSRSEIFVLDRTDSFTGAGNSDWIQDGTEWTLSRNTRGLPLSIQTQAVPEGGSTLQNEYLAELSYYDNDSLFEYKLKEWTGSEWSDVIFYEKYRSDGQLSEQINGWYYTRTLNTYDASGRITESLEQDDYGTWQDYARTLYTYDDNGFLINEEYQQTDGSTWTTKITTDYTYKNDLLVETFITYVTEGGKERALYEYYDTNLLKTETTQEYNGSDWDDVGVTSYTYNTDGKILTKEEVDSNDASYSMKHEYTYNSFGEEETYFLYENSESWSLFYKGFDEYDENQNIVRYYTQFKNESGVFDNFDKYEYSWSVFSSVQSLENTADVKIFPNPASSVLNFTASDVNAEYDLIISDIFGKTLSQIHTDNIAEINIEYLNTGIYFLTVRANQQQMTLKFVKK